MTSPHTRPLAGASVKKKARKSVTQPDNFGYPIKLVHVPTAPSGFKIVSGCRNFTVREARDHWRGRLDAHKGAGRGSCDVCARACKMLALLPTLKRRARSYGWLTAKAVSP